MSTTATETLSVVVERDIAFPPEKIWRALTQPHLIEEWLMKNDFKPVVDYRFNLRGDWGAVDCKVLAIEPNKKLSYTWDAMGLESVVTWTLTPTSTGTHLRMEQSGFRPDQQQAYQGAKFGWQKFLANMEQVLTRIEGVNTMTGKSSSASHGRQVVQDKVANNTGAKRVVRAACAGLQRRSH
jgi:uncharacterized protein YndB with AHSA1/START domain